MNINNVDYVTGMFRGDNGDKMVTHLYKGTFDDPGFPMCSRGWQRKWYDKKGNLEDYEYSIFRNNVSESGICKVCLRRANAGLPPIEKPPHKSIAEGKENPEPSVARMFNSSNEPDQQTQ